MEYALIIILQFLGIGFSVMQKVSALSDKYPNETRKGIIDMFFKEDWDTLFCSALVLIGNLTCHFIIDLYFPSVRDSGVSIPGTSIVIPYLGASFLAAFGFGYFGQRIIYKVLGTAEKKISEKIQ